MRTRLRENLLLPPVGKVKGELSRRIAITAVMKTKLEDLKRGPNQ